MPQPTCLLNNNATVNPVQLSFYLIERGFKRLHLSLYYFSSSVALSTCSESMKEFKIKFLLSHQ